MNPNGKYVKTEQEVHCEVHFLFCTYTRMSRRGAGYSCLELR